MVLGVCSRILADSNDVEDAFQATFVVLARKGRSIRKRGSLSSWLFGVARRALRGEPEPVRRKQVQQESLAELARMEKGSSAPRDDRVRPHLTRLERAPGTRAEPPHVRAVRERIGTLSPKQRELLDVLDATASVSQAASDLGVSRSNVYASLRRISRKLETRSVRELLALVREGDLLD